MRSYIINSLLILSLIFSSCVTEEEFTNSPQGNFEALWKIIDRQYCFHDYKNKEYGLDWDAIHKEYANKITSSMTNKQLFDVLSNMVNELRDGHVNLISNDRVSQYREWYDAYPRNFNDSIQSNYLGRDYSYSSGMKYTILPQNIGYIYLGSFESSVGSGNLDEILNALSICNGLIVDVRNNGGGNLTTAERLAERFTNEKVHIGYITYKTGPEHSSFSKPDPLYLEEPASRVRWQKRAVVLTNRRSFSATNDFVNKMKQLEKVTIIGDKTGGGSGLPYTSELPNGWLIRFSASPIYGPNMEDIEFGIEPDIKVDITSEDYNKGIDTIIETAISFLSKKE